MTRIAIRERAATADGGWEATVSFDGGPEYPAALRDPFSPEEERRLEWYFEEHLRFPFVDQVKAREAGESVRAYGEALFGQLFADRDAYSEYREALGRGVGTLRIEVAGSPEFQRLHWEALRDPNLPRALSLDAPMVRRNLRPAPVRAKVQPSPTLNLLVVTARPSGARDVGYRTITRPLVEGLRQANVPVHVEILRPGTYKALSDHLQDVQARHGAGFYHVVHFDVHGALLTYDELQAGVEADRHLYQARYGRSDIPAYNGHRAFLFLEGTEDGESDPVAAEELSDLLATHQVPIAVLNACESGKQVGATETSLGARLMQAGVQMVLAMGYSVTVSAAEILVGKLYARLFAGDDLSESIRRARLELHNDRTRRAYFNQRIDLEDWLLPVAYENQPQPLTLREFTTGEAEEWFGRQARAYEAPRTTYGFVGRDLDVLHVEKRLLTRRNVLLVRGMGGAGKTTLLHHLGSWWQTTGFVDRVFYFGWDARAWTREQILREIAQALYPEAEFHRLFVPLPLAAQQKMLAQKLRAERHLLILDNLESITGAHLAIRNTLPPEEREALRRFVADLAGGRTLVLLGSRSGEEWLRPGTFDDNAYDLPGLDPEAASVLAEKVMEQYGVTKYRDEDEFRRLLKLLDGYPLAIEVVLANLARQTPAQVLEALQAGGVDLNPGQSEEKTENILRCIDYSHGYLSPEAQELLLCLAPFSLVYNKLFSDQYVEILRAQPALAGLPLDRWDEVLGEAERWGLMSPDSALPVYHLQPVFPYFLRSKLALPEKQEMRAAVESAFRSLYDAAGASISKLLASKEPSQKQIGRVLGRLEYENLRKAIDLGLEAQESIAHPYGAIFGFLQTTQNRALALHLSETILRGLDAYPSERLTARLGTEFVMVLDRIASRQLELKQLDAAKQTYQRALDLHRRLTHFTERDKALLTAGLYHQIGRVAEEQRQWVEAEQHYRKALEIYVELNNRYEQADTYHQLGTVAQEQRQWAAAEQHYRKALEIFIEFNDRYPQASSYHQLGTIAQEQRQWGAAEQHYRKALEIKVEFDDRYGQANTYHQLGIVAQEQRQWAEAEQYYRKALEIFIEFNDRYPQASTYHQLGTVAQAQRQLAEAEQHYRKALEIFIEFNDRYSQAGTYHQFGRVAQDQRQWGAAEQHFRKALEIFVEFNDRYPQASTYHQLGTIAQEQRQWAAAEQHYRKTLEICVEFDDRYNIRRPLIGLAWLWRESGSDTIPVMVAEVLDGSVEEATALLRRFSPQNVADEQPPAAP